jgi:hypothetical protein
MAKIVKLTKDNVQVYPQTITEAVADIETSMTLADWMKKTTENISKLGESEGSDISAINSTIERIQKDITDLKTTLGIGTENTEGIDNLTELLTFFKGIKDTDTFKDLMDSLRGEIEGSALTADNGEGDYEDFDTILKTENNE